MMTFNRDQERVLALAGIIQASALLYEMVMENKLDETAFTVCMNSIYNQEPAHFMDVYGSLEGLHKGLFVLSGIFTAPKSLAYKEISRYTISALHLARKLVKNTALTEKLSSKVRFASTQAQYFSATHSNVISSIAQAYVDTLGMLPFRIQIIGRPEIMKRPEILDKARALLMAAVRSAILWQQLGASQWQLLFKRKALMNTAQKLLGEIQVDTART
ncbi:MAG: lysogenization regulator HflD [Gammaproteobacteria bacterium]|nr:lysogenization regulator HflD [Gammaproteobacteria bacterium]